MLEGVLPLLRKMVICKAHNQKHMTIREMNNKLKNGKNDRTNKPVPLILATNLRKKELAHLKFRIICLLFIFSYVAVRLILLEESHLCGTMPILLLLMTDTDNITGHVTLLYFPISLSVRGYIPHRWFYLNVCYSEMFCLNMFKTVLLTQIVRHTWMLILHCERFRWLHFKSGLNIQV